jgi:hypothetical protein
MQATVWIVMLHLLHAGNCLDCHAAPAAVQATDESCE